jgi:hypothetical protein
MELANPNDQDTSRQVKTSENNKINRSVNQIDVAKFTEEVKNQKKEKTVNLSKIKPGKKGKNRYNLFLKFNF